MGFGGLVQSTLQADLPDTCICRFPPLLSLYTPGIRSRVVILTPNSYIIHLQHNLLNVELPIHLSPSPKYHSQVEWDYDHRHPVPGCTLNYHSSTMQRSPYPSFIIADASGSALPLSIGVGNRVGPGASASG